MLGLSSLALTKASLEYFIAKSTFKDYKKHKLFMDNKELLDVQLNGDFYNKLPSDLKSVIIPTYPIVSGSIISL